MIDKSGREYLVRVIDQINSACINGRIRKNLPYINLIKIGGRQIPPVFPGFLKCFNIVSRCPTGAGAVSALISDRRKTRLGGLVHAGGRRSKRGALEQDGLIPHPCPLFFSGRLQSCAVSVHDDVIVLSHLINTEMGFQSVELIRRHDTGRIIPGTRRSDGLQDDKVDKKAAEE
jgi:hypothetical protein